MVGLQTLTLPVGVRIPVPQPSLILLILNNHYYSIVLVCLHKLSVFSDNMECFLTIIVMKLAKVAHTFPQIYTGENRNIDHGICRYMFDIIYFFIFISLCYKQKS